MRIFLSYAQADRRFAQKLASLLRNQGLDVWDPATDVLPGDNWGLKIGDALEMSDAVVVILSPDSAKSVWVQHEIQFALGDPKKEGRLFPVLARRTTQLPWILKKLNVLDATQGAQHVSRAIVSALRRDKAEKVRGVKAARALHGE